MISLSKASAPTSWIIREFFRLGQKGSIVFSWFLHSAGFYIQDLLYVHNKSPTSFKEAIKCF